MWLSHTLRIEYTQFGAPVLLRAVCVVKSNCHKKRLTLGNETVLRFCDSEYLRER